MFQLSCNFSEFFFYRTTLGWALFYTTCQFFWITVCCAIKYRINVTNVVIHLSLQTEHIYPSISTKEEIRLIWWDGVSCHHPIQYISQAICETLDHQSVGRGNTSADILVRSGLTSFTPRLQGLYRCSHTQDITADKALLFMGDRGEFWMIDADLHVFVLLMRKYVYSLTLICLLENSFHMYLIGIMQK